MAKTFNTSISMQNHLMYLQLGMLTRVPSGFGLTVLHCTLYLALLVVCFTLSIKALPR
uniref:CSC1-like protein RXW8 isoform X3 n=1 Tax=Rhizophora mucronata TaxID=61149 RepID=A0A2P2K548_RHIMU